MVGGGRYGVIFRDAIQKKGIRGPEKRVAAFSIIADKTLLNFTLAISKITNER